ncbi:SpoIIE family protein phosphatase [Streptomyces sp. SID12488]|uniref:SpoIIE family protein phosphatase n=1 Tax=Streptomyces sp. SID12488 TaxID=2706040 RepID=UPI0013D93F69|nr:SpoIIE family protein phosphatase [Streptomyces sp. SID12488]NEA65187.1 SpoIIE family protein phosphatase [Streptomyces sp. SID12488]
MDAFRPLLFGDVEALLAGPTAGDLPRLVEEYGVLRRLIEGTAAGVVVLDTELRFLYVNPHMVRISGLSAAELLGRTLAEASPEVERPESVLRQVLHDGQPRELVGTGHTRADMPFTRRAWHATYHRLHYEDGRVLGLAGIFLEISAPQQHVDELERAHRRMTLLDTATARIGTTSDVKATCAELAQFMVPDLADAAGVELNLEVKAGSHRPPPGVLRLRRAALAAVPGIKDAVLALAGLGDTLDYPPGTEIRACLDAGLPWLCNGISEQDWQSGAVRTERSTSYQNIGVHSVLVLPLIAGRRPLGTLSLVRAFNSQGFTGDDVSVALELAHRAARALERAALHTREHSMALELQHALLTDAGAPPNPRAPTAFRYLPADDVALIGGDWFDSLPLPDGRNLLVIGDVMGHGVEAAVAMSHYRSALRALAMAGLAPHLLLTHADRTVADSGFDRVATCLLALEDPVRQTVSYANAGHLPPAFLSPDGTVGLVEIPVGPPLGTGFGSYTTLTRPTVPGGVLLLYTDGLVERRGEDIDVSLRRLTRLRLSPQASLDVILDDVLAQLADAPAEDDIAVLAARSRPA